MTKDKKTFTIEFRDPSDDSLYQTASFYLGITIVAFIAALDQQDSFDNLVGIKSFSDRLAQESFEKILVVTKCDLTEGVVEDSVVEAAKNNVEAPLYRVSGQTGDGIPALVDAIVDLLAAKVQASGPAKKEKKADKKGGEKKKGCLIL